MEVQFLFQCDSITGAFTDSGWNYVTFMARLVATGLSALHYDYKYHFFTHSYVVYYLFQVRNLFVLFQLLGGPQSFPRDLAV